MNTYKGLSTYLNNSFNENLITEANFFSNLFGLGSKKNTETQNKASGLFGMIFSGFNSILGGKSASSDKLMDTMNSLAEKELANEEARLKKEQDAFEQQEIAKLEAQFEYKQAQLDLASSNKVRAYNANKNKLKAIKAQIANASKNGTMLLHTAEESQSFLNEITNIGREIDPDGGSPATQLTDLFKAAIIKEDGSTRTLDEIKKIYNKNENDLTDEEKKIKSYVKSYNEIAEKHGKALLSGMESKEFKELYSSKVNEARNTADLQNELENTEQQLKNLEERASAIDKCDKIQKEYDDAAKEYDDKKKKLDDLTGEKSNLVGKYKEVDGKTEVEPLESGDYKSKILALVPESMDGTNITEIKQKLKDAGIPEELCTKIIPNPSDSAGEDISAQDLKNAVSSKLEEIDESDIKEYAKKSAEDAKSKIISLKSEVETAKETLDTKVNLNDSNLSDDEKKDKLKEHYPEDVEKFELKKNLSETALAESKPGSDAYNKAKEKVQAHINEVKNKIKENDKFKKANQNAREKAVEDIEFRSENSIPAELKDEVEAKTRGLEPGEAFNDKGKLGFWGKDKDGKKKWIQKPGANASEEDIKQYKEQRDNHLLTSNIKDNESIVKTVKKEGDEYVITFKDGSTDKCDEKTALEFLANKRNAALTQSIMMERKQAVADVFKKCVKDGKIDMKEFKAATAGGKNSSLLADINTVINSDNPEGLFDGLDFNGATASEIKNALSKDSGDGSGKKVSAVDDLKNYLKNEFDDDSTEYDYKNRSKDEETGEYTDNDNWEDVEDDDEDLKDDEDKESDEEDEENAKNESGDKLVKVDGKWYKKSDIDENGKPKSEATPQKNTSKKILKNPAKIWKRKKKKNGKGTTKSYYNKDGESISADDYKEKVTSYKRVKKKQSQQSDSIQSKGYTSLSNYLLEKFN